MVAPKKKASAPKAEPVDTPDVEAPEPANKSWLDGKKTYASLAGAISMLVISIAGRHGVDLDPWALDITQGLTLAFTFLAVWARKQATKTPK